MYFILQESACSFIDFTLFYITLDMILGVWLMANSAYKRALTTTDIKLIFNLIGRGGRMP